jgi:hypothetical protein
MELTKKQLKEIPMTFVIDHRGKTTFEHNGRELEPLKGVRHDVKSIKRTLINRQLYK